MQDVGKDVRSSEFVVRFCEYRNLSFFFFYDDDDDDFI